MEPELTGLGPHLAQRKGRSKAGVQLSVSGTTEFSAMVLPKHK